MTFYIFAVIAVVFALTLIFKKNPVSSAFSLIVVFLSFAGIYAVLGAHLIAAMQIIVYTGAIMVLFIFVIMLLSADVPDLDYSRTSKTTKITALIGGLTLWGILTWMFKGAELTKTGTHTEEWITQSGGNTQVLSELLFSEYILPFELTSILLLAAIIGAVAIAKRKRGKKT
ncbi:MAG: NADH-quinone oxidoreductase subunit J [Xanthomonadaceae bacterium]|nr:NADH-quinone oxidoreductase subunit J [Xanthomonadaceae bacterium]